MKSDALLHSFGSSPVCGRGSARGVSRLHLRGWMRAIPSCLSGSSLGSWLATPRFAASTLVCRILGACARSLSAVPDWRSAIRATFGRLPLGLLGMPLASPRSSARGLDATPKSSDRCCAWFGTASSKIADVLASVRMALGTQRKWEVQLRAWVDGISARVPGQAITTNAVMAV